MTAKLRDAMSDRPDTAAVLRVFLASPGDVDEERAYIRELLESRLPRDPWLQHAVSFQLIAWDHPFGGTPMLATMTPQDAVTRFTGRPADCDIVIVRHTGHPAGRHMVRAQFLPRCRARGGVLP